MRLLVLSVDYEVFGDGSGDPREHIHNPTVRLARSCDKFSMPLTIYVEVEEYLAFCRERVRLVDLLGYDPAEEIRAQLVELARKGHDLQLHLHPEWVGAKLADGRWVLHDDKCTVDSLFETVEETSAYIHTRKAVLDDLLTVAGCRHQVTAYRAGAFCAQPGSKLLHALAANGFVLDSSVVKGMTRRDQYAALDFRGAPQARRHWPVQGDVAQQVSSGTITEVPIYSQMGRRFHQLTPKRLLAKFARHVPKEKQRAMVGQLRMGRNPASIARFLLQRFPIKLDFHNQTAAQMLRWIRNAPPPPPGDLDVIVLIGHTKEHRDDTDFGRFLSAVSQDPSLEVISMTELSRRLLALRHQGTNANSAPTAPIAPHPPLQSGLA